VLPGPPVSHAALLAPHPVVVHRVPPVNCARPCHPRFPPHPGPLSQPRVASTRHPTPPAPLRCVPPALPLKWCCHPPPVGKYPHPLLCSARSSPHTFASSHKTTPEAAATPSEPPSTRTPPRRPLPATPPTPTSSVSPASTLFARRIHHVVVVFKPKTLTPASHHQAAGERVVPRAGRIRCWIGPRRSWPSRPLG
jgi:hypothetical protein